MARAIGTEHTLLGLLSEPDGIAGVVLRRLGAADAAATETRKIMDSEGYNPTAAKTRSVGATGRARSSRLTASRPERKR